MIEKDLYQKENKTIYEIAKIVGLSPGGVWKRLKKQGVKIIAGQKLRGKHWSIKKRGEKFLNSQGYIELRGQNRKREHIIIMEDLLKRNLKKNEVIHHINKIRTDNRPENLVIVSPSEHSRIHHLNIKNPSKGLKNRHPRILKLSQIKSLRKEYSTGKFSQVELSKKYKIHQTTISSIINRKVSY